jgi:cytochrome b6-f complex iron-sulfur subunit
MSITRRSLLKGGLASSALVIAHGCGNDVNAAPIVDATIIDDWTSPQYGMIPVTVPMYPQLQQLGGAVTLRLAAFNGDPTRPVALPPKNAVLLVHRGPVGDDSAEFIATNSACTHQGCPLGYNARAGLIECPCHGSRFRASGASDDASACTGLVVHKPAPANLTVYSVDGDASSEVIYVDLNTQETCGIIPLPPVVNGMVTVPIAMFPALGSVGGSVIGQPKGLADKLIIARVAESGTAQVITLSDICTHMGCGVALDVANSRFDCPCHASEYKFDGTVITGPAPLPLKVYATTFDGTNVVITVG